MFNKKKTMIALYLIFCGVLANAYAVFLSVVWLLSKVVGDGEKTKTTATTEQPDNGEITGKIRRKTAKGVEFTAEASENGLTWGNIIYLDRIGE